MTRGGAERSGDSGAGGDAAPRVLYAITTGISADFLLRGQLAWVRQAGFAVTLVAAPGPRLDRAARRERVDAVGVPMGREISLARDALSFLRLWRLLRRLRPTIVNASTPKAGLLCLLAARLTGVPIRVYTLRGLRLETTRGWKRRLLAWGERRAAAAAHRVVAVSASLRRRFLELELGPEDKVVVLGSGSSNGVACGRSDGPDPATLRAELGLPPGAPVVGFVGRLTRDKGVGELVAAFDRVRRRRPEARLLVLGEFEPGDPVGEEARRRLADDESVVLAGFVDDPSPYYAVMDVLAFPSHREGFPNAPLEAALAGVPTVGFAVTGTVDAIVDGKTGTLVPAGAVAELAAALADYLQRPGLAREHGEAARARAASDFRPEAVWSAVIELYRQLLAERPPPRRPEASP